MRFTRDHKDRVRYWLTDAAGVGQPIFMYVRYLDMCAEYFDMGVQYLVLSNNFFY